MATFAMKDLEGKIIITVLFKRKLFAFKYAYKSQAGAEAVKRVLEKTFGTQIGEEEDLEYNFIAYEEEKPLTFTPRAGFVRKVASWIVSQN